jgi:hypothetical protein
MSEVYGQYLVTGLPTAKPGSGICPVRWLCRTWAHKEIPRGLARGSHLCEDVIAFQAQKPAAQSESHCGGCGRWNACRMTIVRTSAGGRALRADHAVWSRRSSRAENPTQAARKVPPSSETARLLHGTQTERFIRQASAECHCSAWAPCFRRGTIARIRHGPPDPSSIRIGATMR